MTNIVLIDDDKDLCDLLAEHLMDEGYNVRTAENGRDGLEKIAMLQPDLVVTDIVMPVMDGIEVIGRLNGDFPEIKVIAISGQESKADPLYLQAASAMGAVATLQKPFPLRQFMQIVRDLIGNGSADQEDACCCAD